MKKTRLYLILGVLTTLWLVIYVLRPGIPFAAAVSRPGKMKPDRDKLMYERVDNIRKRCRNFSNTDYWRNASPAANLYTYAGVTYCQTQKVGCTYWLQILRFLSKDYSTKKKDIFKPSDIDRHQVHFTKYKNITRSQFIKAKGNLMLSTTKSFMFTRHPLTRLWSAYIDKFFLPDFWTRGAIEIAEAVREQHKKCVSDISFEEFLNFIAVTPSENTDWHWKPVHLLCSPCHAKFDVIGKQETFTEDSAFIIDKFGLRGVEQKAHKDTRVREEIEMLVKYNLLEAKRIKSKCLFTTRTILERLWIAFQMNGYIHRNTSFPLESFTDRNIDTRTQKEFLDIIFETLNLQTIEMKRKLKSQKRDMLVEAFKTIPRDLLDKMINFYKYDFELFNYSIDI